MKTSSIYVPPIRVTRELRLAIDRAREKTHRCEHGLGIPLSPISQEPISGRKFARWVLTLWRARSRVTCRVERALRDPRAAIRFVFREYAAQALVVARCESGYRTSATNGQYRGIFQMGSPERARFGHGETALEQARAAYRYFVASGRDWSPWQCRPNGGLGWN